MGTFVEWGMTAEQVLNMLMTQDFADFYEDTLDSYIIGCAAPGAEYAPSRDDVLEEIRELMRDHLSK